MHNVELQFGIIILVTISALITDNLQSTNEENHLKVESESVVGDPSSLTLTKS